METLENKYKKLQEESNNLYSRIRALEKRDAISKFTVGDCYLDTKWNDLIKIVSIKDNYVYYICLGEAIQWTGKNLSEIDNFMDGIVENKETTLVIHTLEGDMEASVGDYIIKGVNGEFYPCKPDIFNKTYEEVTD